jgi:ribonuclease P protein component
MGPQHRAAMPEQRKPAGIAATSRALFPPDRRIRRRGEFSTVFERGTRIHGRFYTFLLLSNTATAPRLGIVASRKIGGAVQRNRAKRLIREMFRAQAATAGSGAGFDLVVIPRRELITADFTAALQDFRTTWRRGVERLAANSRG